MRLFCSPDLKRALERRGVKDHRIPLWGNSMNEHLEFLKKTIQAQKVEREIERRRLNALPRSPLRRLPFPYELIKHIQSFVVGPRAMQTHIALSRLSWSVRTYLFGQNEARIEERWKQICLHSGIGQEPADITDICGISLNWEKTATSIAGYVQYGLCEDALLVSWSQMEKSYKWNHWNRELDSFGSSEAETNELSSLFPRLLLSFNGRSSPRFRRFRDQSAQQGTGQEEEHQASSQPCSLFHAPYALQQRRRCFEDRSRRLVVGVRLSRCHESPPHLASCLVARHHHEGRCRRVPHSSSL
ncbi:hypothetical protein BDY24DRAFT_378023 [Mrakia frigida]|uniref:uncharacterized protein n=1 Tax=Mrakia frigida TaxID=29902 RepID=UPI003FCC03C7